MLGEPVDPGITTTELAEIKARADLATPGPWVAETGGASPEGYDLVVHAPGKFRFIAAGGDLMGAFREKVDAEFASSSRADVPRLVAEVERLNAIAEVAAGYEWALNMLEQLIDKSEYARRPSEMDPPWRFDMYFGDDADTSPIEGRTLLELLLNYFEWLKSDPADSEPDNLEQIRDQLRTLIADRRTKQDTAGEAFLDKLRGLETLP